MSVFIKSPGQNYLTQYNPIASNCVVNYAGYYNNLNTIEYYFEVVAPAAGNQFRIERAPMDAPNKTVIYFASTVLDAGTPIIGEKYLNNNSSGIIFSIDGYAANPIIQINIIILK